MLSFLRNTVRLLMAVGSFVLKSLHLEGAVSHQIKYGDAVHVYFENWASFDLEGLEFGSMPLLAVTGWLKVRVVFIWLVLAVEGLVYRFCFLHYSKKSIKITTTSRFSPPTQLSRVC